MNELYELMCRFSSHSMTTGWPARGPKADSTEYDMKINSWWEKAEQIQIFLLTLVLRETDLHILNRAGPLS